MDNEFNAEETFQDSYGQAEEMLEKPDKVEKLLKNMRRKLEKLPFCKDQLMALPKMALMVHSFIHKQYTKAPVASISSIIAAIAYFVMPFDVIPDILPFVGFLDDIGLVAFVVSQVGRELDEYMDWRYENGLEGV